MSRDFGRVKTAFWDDEDVKPCAPVTKMVALYLLTSPHTNAIGCFKLPPAYMAEDTGMAAESLQAPLAELRSVGFMQWCERLPWIWLPNYLKHNAPENPNVWRKCVKELQSLPGEISAIAAIAAQLQEIAREPRMSKVGSSGRVTEEEIAHLEQYRNRIETVSEARRPYPIPCPNPEPIHDLSDSKGSSAPQADAPPSKPKTDRGSRWPKEKQIPDDWLREGEMRRVEHGLSVIDLRLEAAKFVNYWASKAGGNATKIDWHLTWMNWALDDRKTGNSHGKRQQEPTSTDKHLAGIAMLVNERRGTH